MTMGKMNYGARGEDFFFRTVEVDVGLMDEGDPPRPEYIGVPVPLSYLKPDGPRASTCGPGTRSSTRSPGSRRRRTPAGR